MCGLAGFLPHDPRHPADLERVISMCDAIAHRGPDDSGQFVDGPVALRMRRLSIINLAGGHQPMSTADGRVMIVFNREVCTYGALRRTLQADGHRFRTSNGSDWRGP